MDRSVRCRGHGRDQLERSFSCTEDTASSLWSAQHLPEMRKKRRKRRRKGGRDPHTCKGSALTVGDRRECIRRAHLSSAGGESEARPLMVTPEHCFLGPRAGSCAQAGSSVSCAGQKAET